MESTFGENGNELNENILKIRKSLVETSGKNNFYGKNKLKLVFFIFYI